MTKFREFFLYPIIIVLATVALYHNVVDNEFSGLDDYLIIEENWDKLRDINHIYTAFTDDVFLSAQGTYYRPLLLVSYMPDVFLSNSSEPDPYVFFIFNIFLFTLSAILIYLFLGEFKFSKTYRLIFVLLYISHPSLTPAVAWVPGRNDLILLLCVLPSIWAFIKYIKTQKIMWALIHLLFFVLAIFSKETAIVIPAVSLSLILFYSTLLETRLQISSWKTLRNNKVWSNIGSLYYNWLKHNFWIVVGWVLILLFWFTLRKIALPNNPFSILSMGWQLATSWIELFVMIGAILIPHNLPVYLDVTSVYFLIAVPGFILLIYILKKTKPSPKYTFIGLLWFFLFALPTTLSDLLVFHRLTIPLIGMAFLLSPLDQLKNHRSKQVTIGALSIFAVFFIYENIQFQKAFETPKVYWSNAVKFSPQNPMANNGLAWCYHIDHINDSAAIYYNQVILYDSILPNTRISLALIEEENGNLQKADSLLNEEFKVTKDSNFVYYYIGQIILERGDTTTAVRNLQLGYSVTQYSRNARLYYDTLDISVKNRLNLNFD